MKMGVSASFIKFKLSLLQVATAKCPPYLTEWPTTLYNTFLKISWRKCILRLLDFYQVNLTSLQGSCYSVCVPCLCGPVGCLP